MICSKLYFQFLILLTLMVSYRGIQVQLKIGSVGSSISFNDEALTMHFTLHGAEILYESKAIPVVGESIYGALYANMEMTSLPSIIRIGSVDFGGKGWETYDLRSEVITESQLRSRIRNPLIAEFDVDSETFDLGEVQEFTGSLSLKKSSKDDGSDVKEDVMELNLIMRDSVYTI